MTEEIELTPFWKDMSKEERMEYYSTIGKRLLEHRYRYYVLDEPILEDFEYDYLERYYIKISNELGIPDIAANMVGFDLNRLDAQEAKVKVDSGTDDHSVWEKEMKETWNRLGKPRYIRKAEVK